MSTCRSCGAEIVWAFSEHGRKLPLDAEPYSGPLPGGLFVLLPFPDREPTAIAVPPGAYEDESLYRSHFSTCPDAERWRR